jgi:hypothetical protein
MIYIIFRRIKYIYKIMSIISTNSSNHEFTKITVSYVLGSHFFEIWNSQHPIKDFKSSDLEIFKLFIGYWILSS